MPVHERLSVVVSLSLIGLALYFIIDLPERLYRFQLFGVSLEIAASDRLLMVVLLGALALTGSAVVMRSPTRPRISYTVPFWVNSTLIMVLATLTLAHLSNPLNWAGGLMLTGVLMWLSILAEYQVIENHPQYAVPARIWSQWVSYILLLGYTLLIYQTQIHPFLQACGIFIVAWLVALSIFKFHATETKKQGGIAFLVALGLGQITWVLHYWQLGPTGSGLLVLLIFYLLGGIVLAYQQDRLTGRVIAEYGAVTVVGFWLVLNFVA